MTRQLYTGENLAVMETLEGDSIDLIYLDPPFNSNRDYGAFDDKWKESNQDNIDELSRIASIRWLLDCARHSHSVSMSNYLAFMGIRLLELNRLLKDNGSIYLHIDPTASHYLKVMMDAIFGVKSFRNEIVWCYASTSQAKRYFPKKHDTILFYTKGNNWTFNHDDTALRLPYKLKSMPKRINDPSRRRGGSGKWAQPKSETELQERYNKGKLVPDYWEITFGPNSPERMGYPTQKPLKLLERIILASSNQSDLILDPFCGSGTALIAAEKFGRNWIGIDKNDNHELLEKLAINIFGELIFDYAHKKES